MSADVTLGTINMELVDILTKVAQSKNPKSDPVNNPLNIHAVVLLHTDRRPQLFVRQGDES